MKESHLVNVINLFLCILVSDAAREKAVRLGLGAVGVGHIREAHEIFRSTAASVEVFPGNFVM